MEQLHRSSPSAACVRAVGIHQPRQARTLDTGRLLWYIVFSEFNVCQQLEGSYLRAGQQTIEFAAVFYQHSRIAPQVLQKALHRPTIVDTGDFVRFFSKQICVDLYGNGQRFSAGCSSCQVDQRTTCRIVYDSGAVTQFIIKCQNVAPVHVVRRAASAAAAFCLCDHAGRQVQRRIRAPRESNLKNCKKG